MYPPDKALADSLGSEQPTQSAQTEIERTFAEAEVDCFACTHTCLPFAQTFSVDGAQKIIINNGSAGMSNFRDTTHGLISRIAVADGSKPATEPLYGTTIDGVRFDAVPVHFDSEAWQAHFLGIHPVESPAHESYWSRISEGVGFFTAQQADRIAAA